jgi:streptogramin lyase
MNRHWLAILAMLLCPWLLMGQTLFVVNSQSRTLSRIELTTDTVDNNFASLGNIPNKVLVTEDYLWVVNSGDNSLQKISTQTGATLANHFVAVSSNPWDAVYLDGYIYITGLMTSRLYKMDASSGAVLGYVTVGTAPGALLVFENKIYVCNTGNYMTNYAGSSVSVVNPASMEVIKTIPVHANPQSLAEYNGMIHVSSTGNWTDIEGKISVIDPSVDDVSHTIPLGGTPGRIWISPNGLAYVGDGEGYSLYRYDANDYSMLNPASNPLPFAASELIGNGSMLALLSPQWGENATLQILHPDLSSWKNFTVRMMPSDLKMLDQSSSNSDASQAPAILRIYPNPARIGSTIRIEGKESQNGSLEIFNVKGQKLASVPITRGLAELHTESFPSGMYFYRLNSPQGSASGKYILTR